MEKLYLGLESKNRFKETKNTLNGTFNLSFGKKTCGI
jgi:hypothetical protein